MKAHYFIIPAIAMTALPPLPANAMTQAELNAECTRLWGPPDHHYTPNGCVKGKLVVSVKDRQKQVRVVTPVTQQPAGISDQAAAGNLSSFLPKAQPDGPCKAGEKQACAPGGPK